MSENSDRYKKALAGFAAVVDQIPSDGWSADSPCAGWTAKHVVGHVIGGTQMISSTRTGDAPNYDPISAAGDDPAASFAAGRQAALDTLTDEYLNTTVQGPMGEMPLDQLIGMIMTSDTLIHTWDLAKAAGVDVSLDPELAEGAYNGLLPVDAMVRSDTIFGPKLDTPEDADIQTKLLRFTGRDA